MTTAPYSWPVDTTALPDAADDNAQQVRAAADAAVGVLWALTGRRFGLEPVQARPTPHYPADNALLEAYAPAWGPISSWTFASPRSLTVQTAPSSIVLPGPVHTILSVTVDGAEVDTAEFLVAEGDRIRRRGGGAWPGQDLTRPLSEEGTWAVNYTRGTPPPSGAAYCVAVLTSEFYAAATGGKCQLPRRTQQVQRQGVTVNMVDPSDIYDKGATGISEVDLWIKAHNPHGHAQQAAVWSPDRAVW